MIVDVIMDVNGNTQITHRDHLAAFSILLVFFAGGSSLAWPSPALPKLLASVQPPTTAQVLALLVFFSLGILTSTFTARFWADRFGRRVALFTFNAIATVSWTFIIASQSYSCIYVSRSLNGFWFGASTNTMLVYLSEVSPESKPKSFLPVAFHAGIIFSCSLGPYVSFTVFNIVSCTFPVLLLFTQYYLHESPVYYVVKNNDVQALRALQTMTTDAEEELASIKMSLKLQEAIPFKALLLSRMYKRACVILVIILFLRQTCGSVLLLTFASSFLPRTLAGLLGPSECVIIIVFVGSLATILGTRLLHKVRRKPLLVLSASGCSASMFVTGLCYFLDPDFVLNNPRLNWIPFVSLMLYSFLFSIGLGYVPSSLQSKMFPLELKHHSSKLSSVANTISIIFMQISYPSLRDSFGMYFNFWFYAFGSFLTALITVTSVVETHGTTLEEIRKEMNEIYEL